jgi:two-component system, NarL family, nitrate/nitrite response regulator NarL
MVQMRVLIADDHPLYLEAVRLRLQALYPEAVFVEAQTIDGVLAQSCNAQRSFDLILSDLRMPGMDGVSGVERILAAFPDVPCAIMSGSAEQDEVREVIRAGARGFLPKTMGSDAFAAAVSLLLAGGTYLSTDVLDGAVAPPQGARELFQTLTPRERQVLAEVMSGASNKEIGRKFELAEVTIKLHVRQILKKIGGRNRSQAAALAARAGLI